jgi:N-acetylglucosaminyl-diphospho-decaprenol L-rhamnosyltransferase
MKVDLMIGAQIPIVVVAYRNPADVCGCLTALAKARRDPSFCVAICENGGADAYNELVAALRRDGAPCAGPCLAVPCSAAAFTRVCRLKLAGAVDVLVAEARENLGYAGGINAWIDALAQSPDWAGLWVLNPDTEPEPDALAELVDYARTHRKGMVGSRIMFMNNPTVVGSRGLKWNPWFARTTGVDKFAPVSPPPDRDDVERRIDGPHGASFYVSRPCLREIGPMDEDYFLFFEDLDWGLRAKAAWGLGYAYASVVPHAGGTTIGSATKRAGRSELAVYLDFRNRLLFVRRNYPAWFPWTVFVVFARAFEFAAVGAFKNFFAALRGWAAGLRDETGRPDRLIKAA